MAPVFGGSANLLNPRSVGLGSVDERLTSAQMNWLEAELGGFVVIDDLSWGTTPSGVWKVQDSAGRELVVKTASGAMRSHISREMAAHQHVTAALAETEDAQRLVAASRELGILVVANLPGVIAVGADDAVDAGVHRHAGALLARIHS